jgi:hypothetical protein
MTVNDFIECFEDSMDIDYLRLHYPRLRATQKLAYQDWKWETAEILDVGAHWLHQSVLYALDGHHVTAADFSTTLDDPAVKRTAEKFKVDLLIYSDLSVQSVFDGLETDSMIEARWQDYRHNAKLLSCPKHPSVSVPLS